MSLSFSTYINMSVLLFYTSTHTDTTPNGVCSEKDESVLIIEVAVSISISPCRCRLLLFSKQNVWVYVCSC